MNVKSVMNVFSIVFLVAFVSLSTHVSAGETGDDTQGQVTLTGTVNDAVQFVTESGEVYEINDSEKAFELIDQQGKKMSVVCTITGEDDEKSINVISFEVLDE